MSDHDRIIGQLEANQTTLMDAIYKLEKKIQDMDSSGSKERSELNSRVRRLEQAWRDIRIGTRIVLWVAAAIGSAIGAIGTWIINIMKA